MTINKVLKYVILDKIKDVFLLKLFLGIIFNL